MRLGVDLMGGDQSPTILWAGVMAARRQLPDTISLTAFVTTSEIKSLAAEAQDLGISLVAAPTSIDTNEEPLAALRNKPQCSVWLALQALAAHKMDAIVSCGNTGALLAASVMTLPLLDGLKRPPLLAEIPARYGPIAVLDVGSNLQRTSLSLIQYAYLAAAYCRATKPSPSLPRLALLNVGTEPFKGDAVLQTTYRHLMTLSQQGAPFTFLGNIESRDLFHTAVEAVICDGLSGNILLKTAEGLGLWLLECMQVGSNDNLRQQFDYLEYPGAFFCGLPTTVVKCHGSATPKGLQRSISFAMSLCQNAVPQALTSLVLPKIEL